MSDYISRDEVLDAFGKATSWTDLGCRIDSIPAADVRPNVIGHWIEREDMYYGWNIWECSECHEEFCIEEGTPSDNEYKFCPNCGAKMEGGINNDER